MRATVLVTLLLTTPGTLAASDPQMGWPVVVNPYSAAHATVADIDGDELPEVLVPGYDTGAFVYEGDGSLRLGWPQVVIGSVKQIRVGDIDGDGATDVLCSSSYWGSIHAFEGDGTPKPGWPVSIMYYTPDRRYFCLGDIDGDGAEEVIVASDALSFVRLDAYRGDGSTVAGWPVYVQPEPFVNVGTIGVAAGDLEFDGDAEVVLATALVTWEPSPIYVIEGDGSIRPGWPVTPGGSGSEIVNLPIIVDTDGDYDCEIVGAASSYIFVLGPDGALERQVPLPVYCSRQLACGDVDGDGRLDIVVPGYTGLMVFDTVFWNLQGISDASTYFNYEGATVGDVDGDGKAEIAVWTHDVTAGSMQQAVHLFNQDLEELPGWPKLITDPIGTGGLFYSTSLADLDGDSDLEVIHIDGGEVHAWDVENPTTEPVRIDGHTYHHDASGAGYYHRGAVPVPMLIRGDANHDGDVNISDGVYALSYLFLSAGSTCPAEIDFNADEELDLADAIALLEHLYLDGPPPPVGPYPECGPLPDGTGLRCDLAPCP